MSSKNESSETKKGDENQHDVDSGFLSGFQESSELSTSEVAVDKNIMTGNSQRDDKNSTDSGYGCFTESQKSFTLAPYVPLSCQPSFKRKPSHPQLEKFFEQDEDGHTTLHSAILHNHEPGINALISLVSSASYLNMKNYLGQTALHLAVLMNQQSTLKKLINYGADLNIRDNRCNTALHLACINENVSCVQTIISAVNKEQKTLANLEQWNYEGETCFYIACKKRNLAIMKALALGGANVNAREGRSGYTSLHLAVESKCIEVVKFLCRESDNLSLDTESYAGITAFQLSLLTGQDSLADFLVSVGATPFYTAESDMEYDDDSSDFSGDELENNQIISKIAEIAVN